jgi:hypothetical protein
VQKTYVPEYLPDQGLLFELIEVEIPIAITNIRKKGLKKSRLVIQGLPVERTCRVGGQYLSPSLIVTGFNFWTHRIRTERVKTPVIFPFA